MFSFITIIKDLLGNSAGYGFLLEKEKKVWKLQAKPKAVRRGPLGCVSIAGVLIPTTTHS